jgi:hypothetical protein
VSWLKPKEAAAALGVSTSALLCWRRREFGPPFVQVDDKTILYSEKELETWKSENKPRAPYRSRRGLYAHPTRQRFDRKMALKLKSLGMSSAQIAKSLGVSTQAVWTALKWLEK